MSGMLVRMMLPAVQRINLPLYKVAFDSLPVFDLWLSDSSPMMTCCLVIIFHKLRLGIVDLRCCVGKAI